jgi:hypothetical protein
VQDKESNERNSIIKWSDPMTIEELRNMLDKFINTNDLTDYEVLRIYEKEMEKNELFLKQIS